MSRRSNCHDNAVMEAFFSSLTSEVADRFASCGEAKMKLFDYIEVFYNQRRRRHPTIGQISPAEFEKRAARIIVLRERPKIDGIANPSTRSDQAHGDVVTATEGPPDGLGGASDCSVATAPSGVATCVTKRSIGVSAVGLAGDGEEVEPHAARVT